MKPETRLTNKILKELRQYGGWWFKVHGGPMQQAGIPDILGCYRGRFVALEVKMPGSQTSPRQLVILDRIDSAGGVADVVTSSSDAMGIVLSLD